MILYAKEYNSTPENNRLVRKVKEGDIDAIKQMAQEMKHLVPEGAILIPVPNRSGMAEYTLKLCEELAMMVEGVKIHDIVVGNRRGVSSYEHKKNGYILEQHEYGFQMDWFKKLPINVNRPMLIVDNVISTGNTIKYVRAALKENIHALVHSIDFDVFKGQTLD